MPCSTDFFFVKANNQIFILTDMTDTAQNHCHAINLACHKPVRRIDISGNAPFQSAAKITFLSTIMVFCLAD